MKSDAAAIEYKWTTMAVGFANDHLVSVGNSERTWPTHFLLKLRKHWIGGLDNPIVVPITSAKRPNLPREPYATISWNSLQIAGAHKRTDDPIDRRTGNACSSMELRIVHEPISFKDFQHLQKSDIHRHD